MEVTLKNFKHVYEQLKTDIHEYQFFAIDCEFTGYDSLDNCSYDSPSEYYAKIRKHTEEYIIIQFGLTAFRLDKANSKKFISKTYNFYIYPHLRGQTFSCHGDSISFLAKNGFDFNKLFTDGISSCNITEANKLLSYLEIKKKNRINNFNDQPTVKVPTIVPAAQEEYLQQNRDMIDKFIDGNDSEMILNGSAYQRKLIYEMLRLYYADKLYAYTKTLNNSKVFCIQRIKTTEEINIFIESENLKDFYEYEKFIGMHEIMKLLSNSKKLIIGHNMLLDIIYILRQFFSPLPENYRDFKKYAHNIFPNLLDTKYLSTIEEFKSRIPSNKLSDLYHTILKKPFNLPEIVPFSSEFAYSENNAKEHEAGYDSYLTGVCFIALTTFLNIDYLNIYDKNSHIFKCLNKMSALKLIDINYLNMTGKELKPCRSHVFYISFPENWTTSNIENVFKNYGQYNIKWISNNSAYIALYRGINTSTVIKTIQRLEGFKIFTFKEYKAGKNHIDNINITSCNLSPKRALSDSPLSPEQKLPDQQQQKQFKDSITNDRRKRSNIASKDKKLICDTKTNKKKAESKLFSENDEW